MNAFFPLVSCLVIGTLLFAQRVVLLRITTATSRCQEILRKDRSTDSGAEFGLPTKLTHGQPLPEYDLTDLVTGELINRGSILGTSTIFIYCTIKEYREWNVGLLLAFLQRCWHRVDGNIYVIFVDQTRMQLLDLPHPEVLETYIGNSIVFCVDHEQRVVEQIGLSQTPCILELNSGGVVTRFGFLTHES